MRASREMAGTRSRRMGKVEIPGSRYTLLALFELNLHPDHIWEISQNTPLDDHLYVPEGAFATTHLALTS